MSGSQHTNHDSSPGEFDPHTIDAPIEAEAEEHARPRRFRMRRAQRELITDATRTHEQNLQSREKQYLFWQGLRLPLIALSIGSAIMGHWWIAAGIFAVSLPLPWVSVMIANGQGEVREKRERNVYKPALAREQARHAALEAERQAQLGPGSRAIPDQGPAIIDAEHDPDTKE